VRAALRAGTEPRPAKVNSHHDREGVSPHTPGCASRLSSRLATFCAAGRDSRRSQSKFASRSGGRVSAHAALRIAIIFKTCDNLCGGKGLPPSQSKFASRSGGRVSAHAALRIAIIFKTCDNLCGGKGLPPSQSKIASRSGGRVSAHAALRIAIIFKTCDILCGGKGLPPLPKGIQIPSDVL
jgi:hypothetical protein